MIAAELIVTLERKRPTSYIIAYPVSHVPLCIFTNVNQDATNFLSIIYAKYLKIVKSRTPVHLLLVSYQ